MNISRQLLSAVELVVFDFDGVFTDNTVFVDQEGKESVRCWRSDGLGLSRLRESGVKTFIISTEANPVVSARAKKLKIDCLQAIEDKAAAILSTCRNLSVDPAQTLFVGNDINDIPAFKVVGLPVAVADAYPEVLLYVIASTAKPGGYGAVREICDAIVQAKQAESKAEEDMIHVSR